MSAETMSSCSRQNGESNEWRTPRPLFLELSKRYGPFTLDAAASEWNAQCWRYFDARRNGLKRPWYGRVWLNPPYTRGHLCEWVPKARAEVLGGQAEIVCSLLPGYTSERWWHEFVTSPAGRLVGSAFRVDAFAATWSVTWKRLHVEVAQIRGRVKFLEERGSSIGHARFPSVAVVFAKPGVLGVLP